MVCTFPAGFKRAQLWREFWSISELRCAASRHQKARKTNSFCIHHHAHKEEKFFFSILYQQYVLHTFMLCSCCNFTLWISSCLVPVWTYTVVSFKDILLLTLLFFFLQAFPQWVRMINDTQMDSGERLQWECKATGRPRPTYRWLRNGLPLTTQVHNPPHAFPSFIENTRRRLSLLWKCLSTVICIPTVKKSKSSAVSFLFSGSNWSGEWRSDHL